MLIEVTEDRCGGPGLAGNEAAFGGGKVLRESMGQARATRADGAPDTVITGVVVLDQVIAGNGRILTAGALPSATIQPSRIPP